MPESKNLQVIKERILSERYGKFDFVEKILTREEIIYSRPRVVFSTIAERLSIAEDKINRKTLWSWLSRYKEKYRRLNPEGGATTLNGGSKMTPVSTSEKKVTNMDWLQNIKPLEPESNAVSPVVINVIRSNRNSQKN